VCLSILGGIQPGPLSEYLRAAALGDKGADGLVQRFQLAVYPDPPRSWTNVDEWPHTEAKNRAFDIFKKLVDPLTFEGFAGPFGQKTEAVPEHQEDILFFRFTPEAQEFFDDWRADLEHKLRGDDHPAIEAHLSKYRSLMPSLALIFHLIDVADGRADGAVSIEAAKMSAAWCDFLEQHAQRIYQSITQRFLLAANQLANKIKAGRVRIRLAAETFITRDGADCPNAMMFSAPLRSWKTPEVKVRNPGNGWPP
jgi:hypothetical protein